MGKRDLIAVLVVITAATVTAVAGFVIIAIIADAVQEAMGVSNFEGARAYGSLAIGLVGAVVLVFLVCVPLAVFLFRRKPPPAPIDPQDSGDPTVPPKV